MSTRGRKEEVVYLTSLGSLDLYPNNTPCTFTNYLIPPIYLDSRREYEVGLVSILYPKHFYAITKGDSLFSISFISRIGEDEFKYTYTPNVNILAGDMSHIVEILNNEIYERLKVHLENYNIESIVRNQALFSWNGNNVKIHCTRGEEKNKLQISITFSSGIGEVLGYRSDTLYTFHAKDLYSEYIVNPIKASPLKGVEYLYVYCDAIVPTYFGGQLVNVLDCFPLKTNFNKGINNTIYRRVNKLNIGDISLFITDQKGRRIPFAEGDGITCILHFREIM